MCLMLLCFGGKEPHLGRIHPSQACHCGDGAEHLVNGSLWIFKWRIIIFPEKLQL